MMLPSVALDADLIRSIAEAFGALLTLSIILWRLPYFWTKMRLVAINSTLQGENAYLRKALEAATAGSAGWQAAVESVAVQLDNLKRDVERLRHLQVVAIHYIADLVQHIKDGRPSSEMPKIPGDLEDDVLEQMGSVSQP